MAWWDDTWLNEALGTWLDPIITDRAEPRWRYLADVVENNEAGKAADEQLVARSVRQPVTTKEGIGASFDNGITYYKGSAVLRMIEAWVGKDKFRDFIRAYVRKFAWKNASADDFIASMTESLGADAARAFGSFLDQPGVPRIAATIACDGSPRVELKQSRALPAGSVDPSPKTWTVPVCVRWRGERKRGRDCTLLDKPTGTIPLAACPNAVVVNDAGQGYYRVAYTLEQVTSLIDRRDGWVSSVERRDVLLDALAAVMRDEIAVGDALALVPKLARDRDERVVGMAMSITGLIDHRVLDEDLEQRQRRFVRAAFGPLGRRLRWIRVEGDSDDRQRLRQQIVRTVTWAGDDKLAAQAYKLADRYLKTGRGLDEDIVASVLSAAIEHRGDAALFERLLAAAHAASADRTKHARLLGALGAFEEPALVDRALALMLDDKLDSRDTSGILYWMLWRRETREKAWAWVEANVDKWLGKMRDDEAGWAIAAVTGSACDPAFRARAVALFDKRADAIDGARNGYATALESVDQCIRASARNLAGIRKFLAAY
jgi:aminopeptidase N